VKKIRRELLEAYLAEVRDGRSLHKSRNSSSGHVSPAMASLKQRGLASDNVIRKQWDLINGSFESIEEIEFELASTPNPPRSFATPGYPSASRNIADVLGKQPPSPATPERLGVPWGDTEPTRVLESTSLPIDLARYCQWRLDLDVKQVRSKDAFRLHLEPQDRITISATRLSPWLLLLPTIFVFLPQFIDASTTITCARCDSPACTMHEYIWIETCPHDGHRTMILTQRWRCFDCGGVFGLHRPETLLKLHPSTQRLMILAYTEQELCDGRKQVVNASRARIKALRSEVTTCAASRRQAMKGQLDAAEDRLKARKKLFYSKVTSKGIINRAFLRRTTLLEEADTSSDPAQVDEDETEDRPSRGQEDDSQSADESQPSHAGGSAPSKGDRLRKRYPKVKLLKVAMRSALASTLSPSRIAAMNQEVLASAHAEAHARFLEICHERSEPDDLIPHFPTLAECHYKIAQPGVSHCYRSPDGVPSDVCRASSLRCGEGISNSAYVSEKQFQGFRCNLRLPAKLRSSNWTQHSKLPS